MAVVSFCIFVVVVVLKLWSIKPQIPVKFILQEFFLIFSPFCFFSEHSNTMSLQFVSFEQTL